MNQINISLEKLTSTAQEVRAMNAQLTQELQEMSRIVKEVGSVWESPASETFRARFNRMTPVFENYREIVEAYAKFLDSTVASYEATENTLNQNASSF